MASLNVHYHLKFARIYKDLILYSRRKNLIEKTAKLKQS